MKNSCLLKNFHRVAAWSLLVLAGVPATNAAENDYVNFVDPRIGVLGEGSCVIGPSLPFASIHPSPDTPDGGHDGYHPERPIRGFSQTHVSGTGWGQYGNFLISPQIGLATLPTAHDSPKANEVAEAGHYQARLTRYDIKAEVTPTAHAAIYRFTFPASDQAHIVLDATQHIPGDIVPEMFPSRRHPIPASVHLSEDGRSASGSAQFPGGFGGPYEIFFYAEFDRTPTRFGTWSGDRLQPGAHDLEGTATPEGHLGTYARFQTKAGEIVQMKIAVSFLSVEKARDSLQTEIPGWDYEAVHVAAKKKWNEALGAVAITGGTDEQRTIFYTALYHAMIMPRDRTGEFLRFTPESPMWDDHYAIWDTWRTLYPLLTLIRPDIVRGTIQSFIERQILDRSVSDTFIAGTNQLREQGGNGVDMIIADAWAKDLPEIEWNDAYKTLRHNAEERRNGATFDDPRLPPGRYRQTGWIPAGIMSCSFTLEYAYNDFVTSQVAASLGHTDDAARYRERSRQWQQLWNPTTTSDGYQGFIMPRESDGTWVDFDPKRYPDSWKPYFYEANAWTYSYFAPHQVAELVKLMGGPERFIQRLQHAIDTNLLELSNEPSFLIPQLFHYVGRPDIAAQTLAKITGEKFSTRGYPGDDDSGAMSSYYVWAKLGLFPVAGQDIYLLNGPAFAQTQVRRPGQEPLIINRTGPGNYVASVTLNGQPLERSWLRHRELNGAARLDFVMSETPTDWARHAPPPPSLPARDAN